MRSAALLAVVLACSCTFDAAGVGEGSADDLGVDAGAPDELDAEPIPPVLDPDALEEDPQLPEDPPPTAPDAATLKPFGERCDSHEECEDGVCFRFREDHPKRCTRACEENDDCPPESRCLKEDDVCSPP